jgi:integrase
VGSVWQEKRGKWRGKWRAQVRRNHQHIGKTFITKGDATKWVNETERKVEKGQYEDFGDSAHLTLGNLIERYREEITPHKKGAQSETYKLNFLLRQQVARTKILRLTPSKVIEFKKSISVNRKPATVNKYLHYIYTIWETARLNWGIILPSGNPTALVKKDKVTTKIDRILTPKEYQDLLVACSKSRLVELSDIVEFAYLTAMRFGEITKLEVKDIDFEKSIANLIDTKNGEDRSIPFTTRALDICNKYRFRERLFGITRDKFRHYFEQACRKADIKGFRFHDLRACAITNLFLNGWSIAEVSVVSGHKTWSELKRYTRIQPLDLVKKINNRT